MSKDFFRGMGSVINLLPNVREAKINIPSHSDEEAIFDDWSSVGNDLYFAAKKETSVNKKSPSKTRSLNQNKHKS